MLPEAQPARIQGKAVALLTFAQGTLGFFALLEVLTDLNPARSTQHEMPARRRASIVFPEPGGPTLKMFATALGVPVDIVEAGGS